MFKHGIGFAALVMSAAMPATAQSFDAERQLSTFSRADLKATLAELGATSEDVEGAPNISVSFADGLKADVLLMACEDQATSTNCYGTSILADFEWPEGASDSQVMQAVNTYNLNENFGRAYVDDAGTISLRIYIISDGQITMENYRRQIQLFSRSANNFFDYLYGSDETGSTQALNGTPNPLAMQI